MPALTNQTALTAHNSGRKANPIKKYFLHRASFSSEPTLGLERSMATTRRKETDELWSMQYLPSSLTWLYDFPQTLILGVPK